MAPVLFPIRTRSGARHVSLRLALRVDDDVAPPELYLSTVGTLRLLTFEGGDAEGGGHDPRHGHHVLRVKEMCHEGAGLFKASEE